MNKFFILLQVIGIVIFFCSGCNPTYLKENLSTDLEKLCKKEYNIDVQSKVIGKTIVVFLPVERLFEDSMSLAPDALEKVENVILSTSRVILSTNAELDFYMLIAADVKFSGTEIVLARYFDDLRKLMYGWMSREEYRKRVFWKVRVDHAVLEQAEFDFSNVSEMTLAYFIKHQLEQRINAEFGNLGYGFNVSLEYGQQSEEFVFTLTVADEKQFRNLCLPVILKETAFVLKSYSFNQVRRIVVTNLWDNEVILTFKEELPKYLLEKLPH
ncbi:MAG: hypothetical protein DRP78_02975 [Candidatus Omnitrophota bacterium]|nr:MAG: hypothetical protein DRP78_02975 [Candidatus Omnitrophota bacterium]